MQATQLRTEQCRADYRKTHNSRYKDKFRKLAPTDNLALLRQLFYTTSNNNNI